MFHKAILLFVAFLAAFGFAQELSTSIIKASPSSLDPQSPISTPSAHVNVDKRQASGSGSLYDVTPHPFFSSSIGVLGCKINTNRVAYWKEEVDCDNICVKLTNTTNGRTITLLRIDHSGGAHDISYDARMGKIDYEYIPADNCKSLITDGSGKLPLQGANSMNFLSSCLSRNTWVGKNYQLWNINDSLCHKGYDEKCTLAPGANQATCPHAGGFLSRSHGGNIFGGW
ncbi:hypothetical protein N0V85_008390 [Neurospora sp. IMI 360204]|nr:hypothetical protein N0V85_008390 [Neurospora sp. IMI 360204]